MMTTKFNIEEKAKGLYNRIRFIPDRVTIYAIEQDFKDAYDAGKLEERQQLTLMVDKIGTYQEGIEEPFVISAEEVERNLKLARDIRNRK